MRFLLIGGSGQLGTEIKINSKKRRNLELLAPSSRELNITNKKDFKKFIKNFKPHIVINTAAYTNVDGAEEEKELSQKINFKAIKNLIPYLSKEKILFIQISTDYVFGSKGKAPYKISDQVSPMTFYGLSKAKAEELIIANLKNFIIIRSASLIGLEGKNFFKTIMNNLRQQKELKIISDQKISITWSRELAEAILNICESYKNNNDQKKNISNNAIIHIVNRGHTNWYELSKEIALNYNKYLNNNDSSLSNIRPILYSEWTTNSVRPLDSRLDIDENTFVDNEIDMSHWKDAVRLMTKEYLREMEV